MENVLTSVDQETIGVPIYYSGFTPEELEHVGQAWLSNNDQCYFLEINRKNGTRRKGLVEIAKGSRVLYHHCSLGPGVQDLLDTCPGIKLTLNDIHAGIIGQALDYVKKNGNGVDLENTIVSQIEHLPPEYTGYDVMITHEAHPYARKTVLIYLTRTKPDGRIIATGTNFDYCPIDILDIAHKLYGLEFKRGSKDNIYGETDLYKGELFNSPEAQKNAQQDLEVLKIISEMCFPKGSNDPLLKKWSSPYYRHYGKAKTPILKKQELITALNQNGISIQQAEASIDRMNRLVRTMFGSIDEDNVYEGVEVILR